MKTLYKLLAIMFLFAVCSCVQKSYNRTIVFKLDAKDIKNITTAGIRGNDKPLNWDNDFPMTFDPKDSLYKATITGNTGYLFTEVKFVVNGEFEFKDRENRKIYFENKDTIVYNAVFNKK
ncbi:MAG: hypothetical protein PSV16_09250 [Flavobacterium sp.]|nr:hypothetical protein [Flavobacterium sp.]